MSITRITIRRATAVTGLLVATVLVTGCGSGPGAAAPGTSVPVPVVSSVPAASSAAVPAATPSGPSAVAIRITDAKGCVATPDTVPAGVVDFTVTNVDATGITELELISDQRIIGERENLTPGFDTTFSVRVDGGSYQLYCPGAPTEKTPFTVTGKAVDAGTGNLATLLQQATVDYGRYVDNQIEFMLPPVRDLLAAIGGGDLAKAQLAYARARPFYERIEPVAESFPDLDPAIDLRIGDVGQGVEWTGFHPIEKALFEKKTTKNLDTLAAKLLADSLDLQSKAKALSVASAAGNGKGYQPFEIANGASGLLEEVLKSKITGEEEAYSLIDLLDFQANVEGSLQAFATLEPALDQVDKTLVPQISARFDALTTVLDSYRDAKAIGGFVSYPALTAADKKKLTDALLAVQEPLSAIVAKITR